MNYQASWLKCRDCATVSGKGDTKIRRALLVLLVASHLSVGLFVPGAARTWHVPGDAPTIQGGIDLAQAGDDVLVGPGSYYESSITLKGGVWVHSEQGPAQTIVDAVGLGRAFDCVDQPGTVTLEGFSIHRGRATGNLNQDGSGGGIRGIRSDLMIRDCVFTNCAAAWDGGGMALFDSDLDIERCLIRGCSAGASGGGITSLGGPRVRIRDSRILENVADFTGGTGIMTMEFDMARCEVSNNAAVWGTIGGLAVGYATMNIRECIFANNEARDPQAEQVGIIVCNGTVDRCTITGGQWSEAVTLWGSEVAFRSTLISRSSGVPVGCQDSPNVSWTCCDVYVGYGGGDLCGNDLGGNFSLDPLFCDAANGDYTLDWTSPCLPGNHPDGVDCGLIGALGAGCGTPPVTGACCFADDTCVVAEPQDCASQGGSYLGDDTDCDPNPCISTARESTTWGRIRAGYR